MSESNEIKRLRGRLATVKRHIERLEDTEQDLLDAIDEQRASDAEDRRPTND